MYVFTIRGVISHLEIHNKIIHKYKSLINKFFTFLLHNSHNKFIYIPNPKISKH